MQHDFPEVSGPIFLIVVMFVALQALVFLKNRIYLQQHRIRCISCGATCPKRTAREGFGVIDPIAMVVHPLCEGCYIGMKAHTH